MSEVTINLQHMSYNVVIEQQMEDPLGQVLKPYQGRRMMVVTDRTVNTLYGDHIVNLCEKAGASRVYMYNFDSGETSKTLSSVNALIDACLELSWNRDDIMICLGGGIVGDMGAFAASILLRGVPMIQIPTTLLAQVDSSIGGKTGVNHVTGKNLIGSFYHPLTVLINPEFLKTLPLREIQTGLSEVIKYGVIRDEQLFDKLDSWFQQQDVKNYKGFDSQFWTEVIDACVTIKANVVVKDEKESSYRMILNYGHTFGHAIEKLTDYTRYTHGEAVAIGMNIASYISWKSGICDKYVWLRQKELIARVGLPIQLEPSIDPNKMIQVMEGDKKARSRKPTLILPERIGKVRIETSLAKKDIRSMIKEFQNVS